MPARTGFTAGNTKRSGLFPPFAAVPPLSLGAFRLLFSPGQSAAMVPLEPPPCAVFQQAFLERRRRSHSAPVSLSLSPRCIFLFCFVNFPSIPRTKPPPPSPFLPGAPVSSGRGGHCASFLGAGAAGCAERSADRAAGRLSPATGPLRRPGAVGSGRVPHLPPRPLGYGPRAAG